MFFVRLFLGLIYCVSVNTYPTIQTQTATVIGTTEDINVFGEDFRVSKFLGIPYAEPPIGELRFKKPVPKTAVKEPFKAVRYGNACLQFDIGVQPDSDIIYAEDCLYLNIYTPERNERDEKLAVMVWIHGGGFVIGSSDIYQGDHLAAYGGVVVVTFNYRLSLWGFLSTCDEYSPGNYGLWDQHMAITWIHDNIEAFGGDPERVTLFGESAGAASVIFQGLYPENKGLFQRMIAQSGTAGSWWANNNRHLQDTLKLARLAGCETSSSKEIILCLKTITGKRLLEIVELSENAFKTLPTPFIPNIDRDFITTSTRDIFMKDVVLSAKSRDLFLSLDLMTGTNSGEGSLAVSSFFGVEDPENFIPNRTEFERIFVPVIQTLAYPESKTGLIKDVIVAEYTHWEDPEDEYMIREEFLAMHADFAFSRPLYSTLDYHSASLRGTYMYHFDEVTSNHLFCNMSWFDKLGHGDEIPFVFGYSNAEHVLDWAFYAKEWEQKLSKSVMKLWSNFAKTGNPNSPDDLALAWLQYTKRHQHYLHISRGMTSPNVKQRWNTRRANLWLNILPEIVKSTRYDETVSSESLRKHVCEKDEECVP